MIKRLLKSVREYKKYVILTPVLVSFEVVLEVLIPLFMSRIIDEGLAKGDMNTVYVTGGLLVLFALISLFCGVTSGICGSKASTGFAANLRHDLYYKVQDFSFYNIDKFSTSSLITRLTTDVSNIQFAFQMIIRIAVRAPLMLIMSVIAAFSINSSLALIYLLIIPILGLSLFLIGSRAHPTMKKVFATYDDLNNVVEENVSAVRVVKSFTLEDEEEDKFKKVSKRIHDLFVKGEKMLALNSPVMQFCGYLCIILISWFGAHLIVESNATTLTTGNLMTLFTYTTQILGSLMMLSMIFIVVIISKASGDRIAEVLNETPDIKNPEHPVSKVTDGSIEFKDVSFSYIKDEEKLVLDNINLSIKSGETVGIIGGTGSGKSSLVNLIPRLYDVTSGDLFVGGHNVKDYDLKVLRDEVSCVLQKNVLFSGTIIENIMWGDESASFEDVVRVCKLAQADKFINELKDGYNTHIEEGGTNVSGGQKQRLCIARALLKKPKILILDDSTSAVDTRTDKLIQDAFKKEIPNTTKIIIAQRISSVENADKIIVLDNGKIDAIGNHKELLKKNKIYKEVYLSQVKGSDKDE